MHNLNRVSLIGRLTADPEFKQLSSGQPMASLRLATNQSWKNDKGEWQEKTDFHRVVAWRDLAERLNGQVKKGTPLYIEGKLQTRNWQAEDGTKRIITEVVANVVMPLQSASASNDGPSTD